MTGYCSVLLLDISYIVKVKPMERENYGRDATCPARNGPVQENSCRAGANYDRQGKGSRRPDILRQIPGRIPAAHTREFFFAGIGQGLPAGLAKRIDRFAMKIPRNGLRRYCL